MIEFLQSYGIWIVVGLFFLLMFFGRRGRGMGCGMGGNQHDHDNLGEGKKEEQQKADRHSGCC